MKSALVVFNFEMVPPSSKSHVKMRTRAATTAIPLATITAALILNPSGFGWSYS
jgi:hypothetical protein